MPNNDHFRYTDESGKKFIILHPGSPTSPPEIEPINDEEDEDLGMVNTTMSPQEICRERRDRWRKF